MKKIYIVMMAALLTFCGAKMMAAFLSTAGADTNDYVSVPDVMNAQAGSTVTVPISLENSNPNYVGFQMDINLPRGFTPALNEKGKIITSKSDRLGDSHTLSCNYDEKNNVIKIVCSSLANELISDTSGELFSIDLQTDASMTTGEYEVWLNNVVFTTSTSAPEGAVSYWLNGPVTFVYIRPEGWVEINPNPTEVIVHAVERDYLADGSEEEVGTGQPWDNQFFIVANRPLRAGEEVLLEFSYKCTKSARATTEYHILPSEYLRWGFGEVYFETGWRRSGWSLYIPSDANGARTITFDLALIKDACDYTIKDIVFKLADDTESLIDETGSNNFWVREGADDVAHVYNPALENKDALLEYLQTQLATSKDLLNNLTYKKVPGASELSELISTIESNMETYQDADISIIRNIYKELTAKTTTVSKLEAAYAAVEAGIQRVEAIITQNEQVNSTVKAEAEAYFVEVRAALANGSYTLDEAQAVLDRLDNFYAPALAAITITVNVPVAGTLSDEILKQVEDLADVVGLIVTGSLNSDDQNTLMTQLTNVEYLDLSETSLTELQQNIFRGRTNLKTIRLPKNLKTINAYAFYGCTNLQDFEFPATLQAIYEYAFFNCQTLTQVLIPEGVTYIGYEAFRAETSEYWDETQGMWVRTSSNLSTVSLPSTLTSMGESVFGWNSKLVNLTIAEGITNIPYGTFEGCESLVSLELPNTVQSIGNEAFRNCGFKKLMLPNSLQSIGRYAFAYCYNLEEVIMASPSVVEYSFPGCSKLTSITLNSIVPPSTNDNYVMDGILESQCTLYVPLMVEDTYKQAPYWSRFNVVGSAEIALTDITISTDFKLTWTEEMSEACEPNIWLTRLDRGNNYWGPNRYSYGALTLTGKGTLSANTFQNYYDNYNQWNYSGYDNAWFTSLLNKGTMRADNVSTVFTLYAEQWNFLSFPYDVKVADIKASESDPFVIRRYDGEQRAAGNMSDTWVDMKADDILKAGKGYIWNAASTTNTNEDWCRTFKVEALQNTNKNNIFNSDDAVIALDEYLSEFAHNRSWNLVGNPYPCYYDTRAMNTSAPFIVWEGWNYRAYSLDDKDDPYILKPGEAFFIQCPAGVESITLLKEGRQLDGIVTENVYNTNRASMAYERYVFNLTLTGNENMTDRTRFVINPKAKMDYEVGRDAAKFMSTVASAAQLYTLEQGNRFAINERPAANGIVELGLSIGTAGIYTIALKGEAAAEVYLIDRETGVETRIDGTEGYTFNANKGTIEGRFAIRVAGGDITGISNATLNGEETNCEIYDLQGRRVNDATRKGLYIKNGKKTVVK